MKKHVILGVAAFFASGALSMATARADGAADFKTLPPGETIPPNVLTALPPTAPGALPVPGDIVFDIPDDLTAQDQFDWPVKASLTLPAPNLARLAVQQARASDGRISEVASITDPSGIIPLYWSSAGDAKLVTFRPTVTNGRIASYEAVQDHSGQAWPVSCKVEYSTNAIDTHCTYKTGSSRRDNELQHFVREEHLGIYVPMVQSYYFYQGVPFAYTDQNLHDFPPKVTDYRRAGGQWHSQEISATLSQQDRADARAEFAKGFDLYRSGQFAPAIALLRRGLQKDPGNATAYFTLGEIERSIITAGKNVTGWDRARAAFFYQRVVDLAPDSDNAAIAATYLKPGGMN